MSSNSRRTLVSRARRDENINPSSAQRRPRDSDASVAHRPTPLPPYEPPSCPLTASAKRALEALPRQHDKENYARHIKLAIKNVTSSATEPSDRLLSRKNRVKQQREKRLKLGQNNQEKTDREMEAEEYAEDLEKKVVILTTKAEKALRELIDYSEELAMRDVIMKEVSAQISAPVAQPPGGPRERRRRLRDDEEDGDAKIEEDEDVDEAVPALDANILSAVEIHNKLKEDFQTSWASKTMRARYAGNNDYKGFKRVVHDATYGPDGPDVPRANTWFPAEAGDMPDTAAACNRRRLANRTDNIGNAGDEDEDEDDDIIIAGVKTSLKCPLTLKLMEHPLSNNKCVHAFEKTAILEYLRDTGTAYSAEPRRRGQQPTGPKQVKCPQGGCNAMLGEEDFYEDQLLIRQVKRAAKAEAAGFNEDEDDDRDPRGTQRNAQQVNDNGDDEDEDISMQINMKNERISQASGLGVKSSPEPDEDEIEDMKV